jgi:hypothetical protein
MESYEAHLPLIFPFSVFVSKEQAEALMPLLIGNGGSFAVTVQRTSPGNRQLWLSGRSKDRLRSVKFGNDPIPFFSTEWMTPL